MKSIYSFIFVICLWSACCTVSCTHPKPDPEALGRAEAMMETAPDSALALLSTFDTDSLSGAAQRARYALLMSMALDKNGIDTTSFNIIQPALDYYLDHGTPDEILRTRYYQGRILQNAGLRDSALHCFTKAIATAPQIHDSLCLARAFVATAHISHEFYDFEHFINNHLKAAEIYRKLSKYELESDCLLSAFNGAVILEDKQLSDSLYAICNQRYYSTHDQYQLLQCCNLTYLSTLGSEQEIKNYIMDLELDSLSSLDEYLNLALAYHKIGDNNEAKQILDYVIGCDIEFDTLKYLSIAVPVFESLENYKDALTMYRDLSHRLDSINSDIFKETTNTIKEKHAIELKAEKEAQHHSQIIWGYTVGIIILTLGIIVLMLLTKSNRAKKALALEKVKTKELENAKLKSEHQRLVFEKDNLAYRIESLEEESNALKNIIASQKELPIDVQKVIQERIEMLNSLLASHITADEKYGLPYDKWINGLIENIDEFMNTNRMAFQVSHARFIKYLEEHNLTIDEINYVCLYALGLKGKDIGNYMKKPSHVNMSSGIRKKLGLDKHETNLGIYVRNLLKKL